MCEFSSIHSNDDNQTGNKIGYDRATSVASLNELMGWRRDVCYVDDEGELLSQITILFYILNMRV